MSTSRRCFSNMVIILSIILLNCGSAQKNLSQNKTSTDESWVAPLRIEPPPAPGTAKTLVDIIDSAQKENTQHVTVRILKVLGYGSATPPLPIGSRIESEIVLPLLEKINASPELIFTKGDTVTVTLKRIQHIGLETTRPSWRIIQIHE